MPKLSLFAIVLPAALALGACAPTNNPRVNNATTTGALAGAALGAAVSDDGDRLEGAAIGAAAGAIAGSLIGRTASGQCVYRTSTGHQYVAAC